MATAWRQQLIAAGDWAAIPVETPLFAAYHWSPAVIDSLDARRVLGQLVWLLMERTATPTGGAHKSHTRAGYKAAAATPAETLADIAGRSVSTRRSGFVGTAAGWCPAVADAKTRMEMLGCELGRHGPAWADAHPDLIDWLHSQHCDHEQAVAAGQRWWTEEQQHPFWSLTSTASMPTRGPCSA